MAAQRLSMGLCQTTSTFVSAVPQGLIMLEADTNRVVLLTNHVSSSSSIQPNTPITYTNDLDIASDGTIYFTDSVDVHPHRNAQHINHVTHIISTKGVSGYYDTVKGWAVGMLQVSRVTGGASRRLQVHVHVPASMHLVCELPLFASSTPSLEEGGAPPVTNARLLHEIN